MTAGSGETDALLRQLRGYIRVWRDPPENAGRPAEQTREHMARCFIDAFVELDERVTRGELLPEAWDQLMQFQPRDRIWGQGDYAYIYPPGMVGPSPCGQRVKSPGCLWLNPVADKTCCARCHTIRIRKSGH